MFITGKNREYRTSAGENISRADKWWLQRPSKIASTTRAKRG